MLSTILPVGCTRRNTARYSSSAPLSLLFLVALGREPLPLLMGGQRVVLLQVAERGLRAALRMGRHGRALAARVDASLRSRLHPGVVRPRLGPYPLGIATELPGTGVALAHGSSSSSGAGGATGAARIAARPPRSGSSAAIASTTSPRASRLWPLTSASQCSSAAAMPPARGAKPGAPTRGLTHTIRCASRARRAISRPT